MNLESFDGFFEGGWGGLERERERKLFTQNIEREGEWGNEIFLVSNHINISFSCNYHNILILSVFNTTLLLNSY
jgi:hypothetical protein